MKKAKTINPEGGITLISLIIMVIILIILSLVAIRGIVGDEAIIGQTITAADEYKIEEYKERVTELREGVILENAIMRKEHNPSKISRRNEQRDNMGKKFVSKCK